MAERDELYVGYLPKAPPAVARRVRQAVVALFALVIAVALALVLGQEGFSAAVYEYGVSRDFEGVVREKPYPTLEVEPPGGGATPSSFYLVGPGKLGAADRVDGLDGRRVRLSGSLIYRDGETMVEVEPDSIEAVDGGPPAGGGIPLGRHTLVGEIVDSKCYLGIMKPGAGKPHRACATRCIAGGIPPVFVVRDDRGPAATLLLVGADGRAVNQEVLGRVAEPLEVTGEVERHGDLLVLKAEPAGYRRLP